LPDAYSSRSNKRAIASPDPLDAVIVEGLVSADDGQLLDQGLRDDQSIEGITVMEGYDRNPADVGNVVRGGARGFLESARNFTVP